MAAAKEFIKNKRINLNAKTLEPGKIEIVTVFDKDNIIDITDYSKVKRPEAPKADMSPKIKNAYIVGQPFIHNLYGKGKITKTRKAGNDEAGNPLFNITVDFNGKEKTFRLGRKQKEMAQ